MNGLVEPNVVVKSDFEFGEPKPWKNTKNIIFMVYNCKNYHILCAESREIARGGVSMQNTPSAKDSFKNLKEKWVF